MAKKAVVSALQVLTSNEFLSTEDWADNEACQALVCEYFTGSGDETSDDESDNGIYTVFNSIDTCFPCTRQ